MLGSSCGGLYGAPDLSQLLDTSSKLGLPVIQFGIFLINQGLCQSDIVSDYFFQNLSWPQVVALSVLYPVQCVRLLLPQLICI